MMGLSMDPGKRVTDRYVIEGVLGRGGMGTVVRAFDERLDRHVAMKILRADLAENPVILERFVCEARASSRIRGEHVARVLDVGEMDGQLPFFVMELLEGRDLAAELEAVGPLPIPVAVDYVLQACEALAEAHSHKIIHRDIKPANLFLTRAPDGTPFLKVLDFGISKGVSASTGSLTSQSSVIGSPRYMSPEQMRAARDVDERTDIWSLGVVLYELLSGLPPFSGETLPEICASILTSEPPPIAFRYRGA
jgi:eukaryotic-like serine/threonine-protein kinase